MSGGRVELGLGSGWFDARARVVRRPVPAGRRAVRPARGAAGDRHRAVGDPARRDVLVRRDALHADRHARRCRSRCSPRCRSSSAARAERRTPELAARFAAEYNVPFDTPRGRRRLLRAGPPGLRGGRSRPGVAGAVRARRRSRSGPTRRRYVARAEAGGDDARRAADGGPGRHAGRGRRQARPAGRAGRRPASTCRCWTSPTSTTSGWSPPRSPRTSSRRGARRSRSRSRCQGPLGRRTVVARRPPLRLLVEWRVVAGRCPIHPGSRGRNAPVDT